jgi:hypothetical protein
MDFGDDLGLKKLEMKRLSKGAAATANSPSSQGSPLVPQAGRISQGGMLMKLFDSPEPPGAILVHQIQKHQKRFLNLTH